MPLTDFDRKILAFCLSFARANMDAIEEALGGDGDGPEEPPFITEGVVNDVAMRVLGEPLAGDRSRPSLADHKDTADIWNDPVWNHNANVIHRMLQSVFSLAHAAGIMIEFRRVEKDQYKDVVELSVMPGPESGDKADGDWCYACPDVDREPRIVL
jgi:hypothetical protein